MTARPRRTTTLVGPNRLVVAGATGALVALASAGTALLVLTGTSSVAPVAAPAPPLPSSSPLTRAPGVVVLPSAGSHGSSGDTDTPRATRHARPAVAVPVALAFTDVPPAPVPAVAPPVVAPEPPALRRTPTAADVDPAGPTHGRHLAKGHSKAKHIKHAKHHGKRVGWAHSRHLGNR